MNAFSDSLLLCLGVPSSGERCLAVHRSNVETVFPGIIFVGKMANLVIFGKKRHEKNDKSRNKV